MARIAVAACGVCGSDVHMLHGIPLPAGLKYPVRPGHEVAGRVIEVLEPAHGIQVGDDVLHIYDPCGECAACLRGRENRCPRARVLGIHAAGGLADEVIWPTRRIVPIVGLPHDQAALLPDAVASAYHALQLAGVGDGSALCVVGAGGVGTHALQVAQALWPTLHLGAVVRTETSAERIRQLGIFSVSSNTEAVRMIKGELGEVDAVVDFSGSAEASRQAVRMLKPGGRLVLGSVSDEPLALGMPLTGFAVRELSIVGSFGSTLTELRTVVELAVNRQLNLEASVSYRFRLEEVEEAFQLLEERPPGLVRMVVEPAPPNGT
jgi:2-desacetyl-2-hydroxyethyl bacteriochlorophyllide A dehydrogenase